MANSDKREAGMHDGEGWLYKTLEAERTRVAAGRQPFPSYHLFNDAGEVMVLATPWDGSQSSKNMAANLVRLASLAHGATSVIFCSEVWTATDTAEHSDPRPPHDRPDRGEAIMLYWETRHFKRMYSAKIDRSGPTPTVGEPEILGTDSGGTITPTSGVTEVLPPPEALAQVTPEMRESIMQLLKAEQERTFWELSGEPTGVVQ